MSPCVCLNCDARPKTCTAAENTVLHVLCGSKMGKFAVVTWGAAWPTSSAPYVILVSMQVRVVYFGILREMAGQEYEAVELPDSARLAELYADLQQRIPGLRNFGGSIALSI